MPIDFKDSVTKGLLTDSQKQIMATAFTKNDDGSIKKGAKLIKSKNYIKLLKRFKSFHR